jgi:hypothetical protein
MVLRRYPLLTIRSPLTSLADEGTHTHRVYGYKCWTTFTGFSLSFVPGQTQALFITISYDLHHLTLRRDLISNVLMIT